MLGPTLDRLQHQRQLHSFGGLHQIAFQRNRHNDVANTAFELGGASHFLFPIVADDVYHGMSPGSLRAFFQIYKCPEKAS